MGPRVADQITVYVNDRSVRLYKGMEVRHALIACDYDLYKAVEEGLMRVEDKDGLRVGIGGALSHEARIYTRPSR